MTSWPAKDPDAVLDYLYRIPLDPEDSIAALGDVTFELVSGSVVIGDKTLAAAPDTTDKGYGQDFTVFLSGGADGEIAVFRIAWQTAGGRSPNDDVVTLPVIESDVVLALTGYMKPAPAHLVARYPAFSAVDAGTIQYWLTERSVDTSWSEGDYAAALMALAAHNMALAGLGTDGKSLAGVPAGITAMKSGSLALNFTTEAANARLAGSLSATRYGQEYGMLLRRNRGGPLVSNTGAAPYDSMRYPQGEA
jgi:hypothetical protein